ncbi:GFA family protein [Marinobacterium lacunae]|nr:GFA family protein [Marinobacterium lacunae]
MKGSCLCGAVTYELDQIDMPIGHCHCNTCRKAHAAAFNTTAGVLREHFRWLTGEDTLSVFESSPGKLRHFCSVCGSHLMAERVGKPHVVVRVATLDDDPGMSPQYHIWTSHNQPWLSYEGLAEFERWQPDRS